MCELSSQSIIEWRAVLARECSFHLESCCGAESTCPWTLVVEVRPPWSLVAEKGQTSLAASTVNFLPCPISHYSSRFTIVYEECSSSRRGTSIWFAPWWLFEAVISLIAEASAAFGFAQPRIKIPIKSTPFTTTLTCRRWALPYRQQELVLTNTYSFPTLVTR